MRDKVAYPPNVREPSASNSHIIVETVNLSSDEAMVLDLKDTIVLPRDLTTFNRVRYGSFVKWNVLNILHTF